MPRVVSAMCLCLALAACSMGHVSLPFTQSALPSPRPAAANEPAPGAAASSLPARTGAKTGLGGPSATGVKTSDPPARGTGEPGALELINDLRHGKGLPPLVVSPELTRAAQMQAAHLARTGKLDHIGPDGSTPLDRTRMAGYKPTMAAENIAGGQSTIAAAVRSWRESESHLRNMLLPDATHMGIAQVNDPRSPLRTYWALVLGASR